MVLYKNFIKLYVCDDEGKCLVEYSAEYEGEGFPLSKYEKLTICSNEKDFDYYHKMAIFAIKTIKDKFSVDVSELKIINLG